MLSATRLACRWQWLRTGGAPVGSPAFPCHPSFLVVLLCFCTDRSLLPLAALASCTCSDVAPLCLIPTLLSDLRKFSPSLCMNPKRTLPRLVSVLCWEGLLQYSETPKSWHRSLPSLLRFLEVLQTCPFFDPSPQRLLAPSEENDK